VVVVVAMVVLFTTFVLFATVVVSCIGTEKVLPQTETAPFGVTINNQNQNQIIQNLYRPVQQAPDHHLHPQNLLLPSSYPQTHTHR
jgi:hypothetical protein